MTVTVFEAARNHALHTYKYSLDLIDRDHVGMLVAQNVLGLARAMGFRAEFDHFVYPTVTVLVPLPARFEDLLPLMMEASKSLSRYGIPHAMKEELLGDPGWIIQTWYLRPDEVRALFRFKLELQPGGALRFVETGTVTTHSRASTYRLENAVSSVAGRSAGSRSIL